MGRPLARSLAEILGDVLARAKPTRSRTRQKIWEAWKDVIGEELAQHTRIKMLKRGVLHVEVESAPELHYLTAQDTRRLAKGVQERLQGVFIEGIKLKISKE